MFGTDPSVVSSMQYSDQINPAGGSTSGSALVPMGWNPSNEEPVDQSVQTQFYPTDTSWGHENQFPERGNPIAALENHQGMGSLQSPVNVTAQRYSGPPLDHNAQITQYDHDLDTSAPPSKRPKAGPRLESEYTSELHLEEELGDMERKMISRILLRLAERVTEMAGRVTQPSTQLDLDTFVVIQRFLESVS